MRQFSFPRKKKLGSRKQFKTVLARKLRTSNGLLTLCVAENDCGHPRLGVSVGKSCGGAVVRNRLKRLLREAFRQNQSSIPTGFDYLLMISPRWSKKKERRAPDNNNRGQANTKQGAKQPTLEQVKTSFLGLVSVLIGKKQTKNSG